ncbi:MAG: universal stress protein [Planctomycetaceae bacterium]
MIKLQKILVPTDFSEPSQSALRYGAAFADQFGASVHFLHAIEHPTQFGFSGIDVTQLTEDLKKHAEEKMEELHTLWSDYCFPVHREIRIGNPAQILVDYAKEIEADMIVMGTHGHGAIRHMLLGSVAERVVRMAPCPVLTVRCPEHEFVLP